MNGHNDDPMNRLGEQLGMSSKRAGSKITKGRSGILRHRLDPLAEDLGRGEFFYSQRLPKEGFRVVFADRMEVWLTHTHQPDHGFGDIHIRYTSSRPLMRADGCQMSFEFAFGELLADECQTGRRCDGRVGELEIEMHEK